MYLKWIVAWNALDTWSFFSQNHFYLQLQIVSVWSLILYLYSYCTWSGALHTISLQCFLTKWVNEWPFVVFSWPNVGEWQWPGSIFQSPGYLRVYLLSHLSIMSHLKYPCYQMLQFSSSFRTGDLFSTLPPFRLPLVSLAALFHLIPFVPKLTAEHTGEWTLSKSFSDLPFRGHYCFLLRRQEKAVLWNASSGLTLAVITIGPLKLKFLGPFSTFPSSAPSISPGFILSSVPLLHFNHHCPLVWAALVGTPSHSLL